jgi:hypothetical protein
VELLAYVAVGALAVLLGLVIDVALSIRRIRTEATQLRTTVEKGMHFLMFDKPAYPPGTQPKYEGGFGVWVYRGGVWRLEANFSAEGYEPGPPPSRPGEYEGYAIRQLSVKKKPR